MKKPFTLNQTAIKQIYDKYKIAVKESDSDIQSTDKNEEIIETPIISQSGFENILEGVFWESLKKEEGKHHNFTLELHKVEETDLFGSLIGNCFFESYTPIEKLSKLAPAFDGTHCKLFIWCEENERPKISGFSEFGSSSLEIKTLSEGEIVISYFYKFSVLFTGSRIEFIKQLETFTDVFQDEDVRNTLNFSKWNLLRSIAEKMKNHEHGGTLLVVNEGKKDFEKTDLGLPILTIENEKWKNSINSTSYAPYIHRYKTHSTDKLLQKLENEQNENDLQYNSTIFWRERLVSLIGNLTSVDGATLINTEFEILGFGAKLEPLDTDDKPKQIRVSEPFEDSPVESKGLSDLGGTRHQSSAQFVYDQKNALAIVASQDGKISLMFWDKEIEAVSIIQHAEYLFV